MSKVYADVVEIPEGITTLLGDGAALNSFRLRDYDAIGKLIIPSTLQLETVPQQVYDELLDMWFDTSHTEIYFSSYEMPGFMTAAPVECKSVEIEEIENHSPYLSIEDGVVYNSDKTRLIFCFKKKDTFVVPASVRIIESQAFCNQTSLKSVTLPEDLEEIHSGAFIGCTSLKEINIPKGISRINSATFAGCTLLEYVSLPEGLIHLGNDAFWHCDSLEEIRLPDSIRKMNSFQCCRSLRRIVVPKGVSVAGGFAFCTSLRTVVLQEGVTKIADYAFRFCDELCRINFPEGLREIGARAFYPSRLSSVVFPKSLEEIGCEAFYHNKALRRITFNSVVKIDQASFACTPALKIILKPKEMKIDDNVFAQDTALDKYGFWD